MTCSFITKIITKNIHAPVIIDSDIPNFSGHHLYIDNYMIVHNLISLSGEFMAIILGNTFDQTDLYIVEVV